MPKFHFECTYCGHQWDDSYWNEQSLANVRCPILSCRDRQLKRTVIDEKYGSDVFGYRYQPEPYKKEEYDTRPTHSDDGSAVERWKRSEDHYD